MEYKKMIGLLAVSGLMLAACDSGEDEASDADTTEETATESEGSAESGLEVIDSIDTESLDFTSDVELEIVGASWTEEGYVYTPVEGEAVITGSAVATEEDASVYAFVIQDGTVIEKPEVAEGGFTYPVATPEADETYQVGVSNEDLWAVGDEADAEELVRYETVIVSATEAEPAAE